MVRGSPLVPEVLEAPGVSKRERWWWGWGGGGGIVLLFCRQEHTFKFILPQRHDSDLRVCGLLHFNGSDVFGAFQGFSH